MNTYSEKQQLKLKARREQIKKATPKWLSEEDKLLIKKFYTLARMMSTGEVKYQVDHIVPLKHPFVCGLHAPWNLQIITDKQNKDKGNSIGDGILEGGFDIDYVRSYQSALDEGTEAYNNSMATRWQKGESGNPNGRPKKTELFKEYKDIYNDAEGNPKKFLELLLERGDKIDLDIREGMRIARDLLPYYAPKISNVKNSDKDDKEGQKIVIINPLDNSNSDDNNGGGDEEN